MQLVYMSGAAAEASACFCTCCGALYFPLVLQLGQSGCCESVDVADWIARTRFTLVLHTFFVDVIRPLSW